MPGLDLGRRGFLGAAGSMLWMLSASRAWADADWDVPPEIRPVSSVVPDDLRRGDHYTLDPDVRTAGFMNRYAMNSDFGPFVAPSDARLRRLVREVAAIAQLRAMQQSDVFGKAALDAGRSVVRSARNLIDDPAATLSAIPEGIGSIFGRVTEQARRSGRSQHEDGRARQILAVSSFKREYAARLGVDAYSSNQVLQDALDRVAWASAAGNLTLGALSFATGALALQVASNVRMLDQARSIVEATPPSELSRRNRLELQRMQVPVGVADRFLQNPSLSPRHMTVIVASMMALGSIPGRAQFIAYASRADTEESALVFQQMAELIAGFSTQVLPVRHIAIMANLPVAFTETGSVVLLPIDRLLWTERSAGLAQSLAGAQPAAPGIWLTGTATPRAEAGLAKIGLALTQRCGERLPLLD